MILFLDIDGVLNNLNQVQTEIEQTNKPWYRRVPALTSSVGFDSESLKWVNYFIDTYNPDIVISSSWRKYFSFDELIKKLHGNGLHGRIVDVTPIIGERAEEIHRWLFTNLQMKGNYIIFEDAEKSVLSFPSNNVVFVEDGWTEQGFSERHFKEAIDKVTQYD